MRPSYKKKCLNSSFSFHFDEILFYLKCHNWSPDFPTVTVKTASNIDFSIISGSEVAPLFNKQGS